MQNPMKLLLRALWLGLTGRTRFERDLTSARIEVGGERFAAFRRVTVAPTVDRPRRPGATFEVRFRFKSLSFAANRRLSLIPIPLIVAQPGFRSKTWLVGQESGDFIGRYEFDTVEQAEAYWDSLPLALMRRRAASGSLSHEVAEAV